MNTKGVTKLLLGAAIVSATGLSGSVALASSAAAIEADASGTAVTYDNASGAYPIIQSILAYPTTVDGYTYTKYSILAADSTGSLDVFGVLSSTLGFTPAVGDAISVTGTYSPFDGIPEVATNATTTVTLESTGNAVTAPSVYTIGQINTAVGGSSSLPSSLGGQLVTIDNVSLYTTSSLTTLASGSFPNHANDTLYASDGTGSMEFFLWASSYTVDGLLGSTAIPSGPVDITGFLADFSGAAQISPTSIVPVPEPATLSLCGVGGLMLLKLLRRRSV